MAQTIKLKRSATPSAVPSTSQLDLGEIAINTYDGKLYIKKDDGTASVIEVGADTLDSVTDQNATTTNTLTIGGLHVNSTGAVEMPTGTEAQRPTGVAGMLRFNTEATSFEGYNGTVWGAIGGGSGGGVEVSDNAPSSPSAGDLWFDSTDGSLNVYYTDVDSSQWVEVSGSTIGLTSQIKAESDSSTTALFPVMVSATGSDQTAKASTNFVFDASGPFLGIGGTPIRPLEIIRVADPTPMLQLRTNTTSTNATSVLRLAVTTVGTATTGTTEIAAIRTNAANSGDTDLVFRTAATADLTEKARLTSTGRLGIGTTAPERFLEVVGPNGTTTPIAQVRHAGISTGQKATLRLSVTTTGGSTFGVADVSCERTNAVSSGDSDLVFSTALGSTVDEKVRITSAGNLGIGTTTPGEKLTVAGTIESTTGGVKFPDGTTQTSAGASTGKAIAMAIVFG